MSRNIPLRGIIDQFAKSRILDFSNGIDHTMYLIRHSDEWIRLHMAIAILGLDKDGMTRVRKELERIILDALNSEFHQDVSMDDRAAISLLCLDANKLLSDEIRKLIPIIAVNSSMKHSSHVAQELLPESEMATSTPFINDTFARWGTTEEYQSGLFSNSVNRNFTTGSIGNSFVEEPIRNSNG